MIVADALPARAVWRWVRWASWPVSGPVLTVAALALAVDVVSAWAGEPEWYLGRILVSPALPFALLLVVLVGPTPIGFATASLAAWREFLVVTGAAVAIGVVGYERAVVGGSETYGVLLTAVGEEVVYRLGAVLLVGASCARVAGRDWRDTASWGTGPVIGGLVGAGLVFSVLPGHVDQMTGVASVTAFVSLAVLLGYSALRTGSLLPCIAVHALLDYSALAYFAGELDARARLIVAGGLLSGLALAMMPAGRRLGMRRRVPVVIDLRDVGDDELAIDLGGELSPQVESPTVR